MQIFERRELSFSQRLALITVLFKKGDTKNLKNYRLLSLPKTDYKIIAFLLARRLQKVINNLIGNEQTAYIKGRFIGANARTVLDIYEYCMENDKDGLLLFLDFEKAFDSVEWSFLIKVLKILE